LIQCDRTSSFRGTTATSTFNGKLNDYIEKVRQEHDQIIDSHNIDTVTRCELGYYFGRLGY